MAVRLSLLISSVLVVTLFAPTSNAADAYSVTVYASTDEVVLGDKVVFQGHVTPNAAGQYVLLQKRYSKSKPWVVAQKKPITSSGDYWIGDRPTSLKTRWYRVVKPKSGNHAAGVSVAKKVTVWKWHYLTDLGEIYGYQAEEDVYSYPVVYIDGAAYKKSLASHYGPSSWVDYNLSRKCRSLEATYGLVDSSAPGAQGSVELLGDGNWLYDQAFALGEHEKMRINIRGFLRIRFEMTQVTTDRSVKIGLGSPRVLCQF